MKDTFYFAYHSKKDNVTYISMEYKTLLNHAVEKGEFDKLLRSKKKDFCTN